MGALRYQALTHVHCFHPLIPHLSAALWCQNASKLWLKWCQNIKTHSVESAHESSKQVIPSQPCVCHLQQSSESLDKEMNHSHTESSPFYSLSCFWRIVDIWVQCVPRKYWDGLLFMYIRNYIYNKPPSKQKRLSMFLECISNSYRKQFIDFIIVAARVAPVWSVFPYFLFFPHFVALNWPYHSLFTTLSSLPSCASLTGCPRVG